MGRGARSARRTRTVRVPQWQINIHARKTRQQQVRRILQRGRKGKAKVRKQHDILILHGGLRANVEMYLSTSGVAGTGGPVPGNSTQAALSALETISKELYASANPGCAVRSQTLWDGNFTLAALVDGDVPDPIKFRASWNAVLRDVIREFADEVAAIGLTASQSFYVYVGYWLPEKADMNEAWTRFSVANAKPLYIHISNEQQSAKKVCGALGLRCERKPVFEQQLRQMIGIAERMAAVNRSIHAR